jgi:hypothetical protein
MELDLANKILNQHTWLLYEMNRHHAIYHEMSEACFSASAFLDHRIVSGPDAKKYKIIIDEILGDVDWRYALPSYPTRYVLHISHVGSTLISRALGIAPKSLALREPLPLRYLASSYSELGQPASWLSDMEFMRLVDFALRSLGRPLNGRTEVVIKSTSWANILAPVFLDPQFGGRKQVIGVYTSLKKFVANTSRVMRGDATWSPPPRPRSGGCWPCCRRPQSIYTRLEAVSWRQ